MKDTAKLVILLISFLALFEPSKSFAQLTALGSGLRCDGSVIVQKNKVVSYSKAKSNISKSLSALRETLKNAQKSKKKSIRHKINIARQTQLLISSCSKGQLAASVAPVFKALQGIYSGTYSVIADGFIPVSGSMVADFAIAAGTNKFSGKITFGGSLDTALNSRPLEFGGDIAGINLPAKFIIQNSFLGTVTATVSEGGEFKVSSNTISLESQLSGSKIAGTLNGSYSGIPFSGLFDLRK